MTCPRRGTTCARLASTAAPTCCAASCGICGGTGCDKRPGGARACCGGDIRKANASCDTHQPPCVVNPLSIRSPIGAHAAVDDAGRVKVLVVAKAVSQTATRDVSVCLPSSSSGKPRDGALSLLTAPSITAKWRDTIRYAGQTYSDSRDGKPSDERHEVLVHGEVRGGDECFEFVLPPLSAGLVVVPES